MLVTSQVSAALTWGWRREECMLLTDAKRNDTFKKSKSWTMNKATKETNRARDGSKRDKPKVARLSKEILRLEESNRSLLASRNYFQQRCAALEKIISAMNADAIPPRTGRSENRKHSSQASQGLARSRLSFQLSRRTSCVSALRMRNVNQMAIVGQRMLSGFATFYGRWGPSLMTSCAILLLCL